MRLPGNPTEEDMARIRADSVIVEESLKNPFTLAKVTMLAEEWLQGNPRIAALKEVNPEYYAAYYKGLLFERCAFFLQLPGYY